jgi:hypothetical protein
MKSVSELENDVNWWRVELQSRRTKLEEAERTLGDRERELAEAQRLEDQNRYSTPR